MIERVSLIEANAILAGRHYLGPCKFHPQFCLAARDDIGLEIVALAVYSSPIASHFTRALNHPLELARLWQADDVAAPLSQFLAATLQWIKRNAPDVDCVFSYADPAVRGKARPSRVRAYAGRMWRPWQSGGVYVAANFAYLGPSPAGKSDHWLDPDGNRVDGTRAYRLLGTRGRKRVAELRPDWRLIPAEPRLLYVYPMARTVAQVIERIGAGHYKAVRSPPSPLD